MPGNLAAGKLPAAFLPHDPAVVLGAAIGEDAAVIDLGAADLLVAKTDPITLATEGMGRYLLAVNGNDLATTGATPRWLLTTLLLPEGLAASEVPPLLDELREACAEAQVALVGGHSEVTAGLDRVIVVGCLLGTVARERLVRTSGARAGDTILLTGGVAIEGGAILAREHAAALRAAGVDDLSITRAAGWLDAPGLSVQAAAAAIHAEGQAHAMHDPTEGGVITALHELAEAAGVGLRVNAEAIAVLPECAAICTALGLDPLGLLASGALLATLDPAAVPAALARLDAAGTPAASIGQVRPASEGRRLVRDGIAEPLPSFERDELTRYLATA